MGWETFALSGGWFAASLFTARMLYGHWRKKAYDNPDQYGDCKRHQYSTSNCCYRLEENVKPMPSGAIAFGAFVAGWAFPITWTFLLITSKPPVSEAERQEAIRRRTRELEEDIKRLKEMQGD